MREKGRRKTDPGDDVGDLYHCTQPNGEHVQFSVKKDIDENLFGLFTREKLSIALEVTN